MNQRDLINKISSYWKENNIFQKSLDQRSDMFQSSTYDGPPFASGTPHFGHGLTSSMKDTILRYKTMKGYKVNRERGRDCHGLPVEKAVEKALGIDGKKDIEEKVGVKKFIEECKNYVSSTSDERETFVNSIGRRADMDHAYYTMDVDFMESVIRAFKNIYNQNLVYKGFNVQRFCPSCATSLSNAEVNEGYQDRQDPAITIKFKINSGRLQLENYHIDPKDGLPQLVRGVIKKDGALLMSYHKKRQSYSFPGGKVEIGDTIEQTIVKEIKEELGVNVTKTKHLGNFKRINAGYLFNLNILEIEISGEPKNMEPDKIAQLVWVETIPSDNKLGFAVKIEGTIIDDDYEIINQFYDLYIYHHNIAQQIPDIQGDAPAQVNFLAWTTTPWTLPSNMFLAVGKHIEYVMVFDKSSKEYYILAEALLKSYYKSNDEYLLVNKFKGEHIIDFSYEALLPYINQSKISDEYKKQFFKVIAGEFVSTEDGTGIVHIAPSFGAEDFEAVAAFLPRQDAKNWLFLPVSDYGEFTDEVPDYAGKRVYDVNKDIIARLKTEGKLIGQKSYSHSYPHCRRCDTPLISKALTSWFIKEPELTNRTIPHAEQIGFVPEGVKNRFRDVLGSAPDRNLARNRYRGSPIPVWENQDNIEERIIIGTLDELYQQTCTGSKNITKNIFIRHAKTDYNEKKRCDSFGKAILNKEGEEQAKLLTDKLLNNTLDKQNTIIILSPLQRAFLTIKPFLTDFYGKKEVEKIEKAYYEQIKHYQDLWTKNKILDYIHDDKQQHVFQLTEHVHIDYRITDHISPDIQDKFCSCDTLNWYDTKKSISDKGESVDMMQARINQVIPHWNTTHPTKTLLYVSHNDTMALARNVFRKYDYKLHRKELLLQNIECAFHYRDNSQQKEVNLHKPYVDNYRFINKGHTYKRIPEVMDCWFESGAMPFGQANYLGNQTHATHGAKKFLYPADFIIEGLDQTRGWFRTMHVVGNALMNKNSFNNVIINGMVLAEDGRKMSKKLKNYPDPQEIFARYGSDAYRLYLLASPGVKAEPVRFSEKGVDQIYKDFTAALTNAYKFFETYAKVDNFIYNEPTVYLIRHAKAERGLDGEVTEEGFNEMLDPKFIENILRVDPDIILTSNFRRTKQTSEKIQNILSQYRNKNIKIEIDERLGQNTIAEEYQDILKPYKGKRILLVSHEGYSEILRESLYEENKKLGLNNLEVLKLPTYKLDNELDKWIIAALNDTSIELENAMNGYQLDLGAKAVLGFLDKLNNWYIRRSRRRFWASGMDQDKIAAYNTLYEVLDFYIKLCAPFAPFISEHIYLDLQKFTEQKNKYESIHLEHLPIGSSHYINKKLLNEIAMVRRIISLGLFIRAKNKIAIKQPLQKINLQIN